MLWCVSYLEKSRQLGSLALAHWWHACLHHAACDDAVAAIEVLVVLLEWAVVGV